MLRNWMNRILLAPEDGGTGGGGSGTGTGSLLGGDGGGGSSGGSGTTGNDDNSSDSSGTGGAAGSGAQDWRTTLPKNMQENVSLKKYTSVEALAGAYINAQKLIGGDKIPVPTSHTTPEEWNGIFRKLGVPEKKEDYKVSFGEKPPVGDTFANAFVDQAYKLGIIPAQAQKLADWFNSETATQSQKAVATRDTNFKNTVAELKQEWGNAFDLEIGRANKVIMENGGKELMDHLNSLGVGADKATLKFLAKLGGSLYGEHKIVEGQGTSSTLSPKELDAAIKTLQAEPAYFDKTHPRHKVVVEEVKDLYAKRYPNVVDKK